MQYNTLKWFQLFVYRFLSPHHGKNFGGKCRIGLNWTFGHFSDTHAVKGDVIVTICLYILLVFWFPLSQPYISIYIWATEEPYTFLVQVLNCSGN